MVAGVTPSPLDAAPDAGPAFSPLYQQIKSLITRSLQAGEWRPGEAIASEVDIAARYKVSQGTVRKAIDELAAENLLVRRQGKGTFVATHAEQQVQYRFLRLVPDGDARADGRLEGRGDARGEGRGDGRGDGRAEAPADVKARPVERRFLDCRRSRANAEIARALELKLGEPVIQARRLLLFSGRPVVLDEIWLHGGLFKGLTAERLGDYRGALYALFETEFGVRMVRAEEKLRAVAAGAIDAPLLGVAEGAPLLSVERRAFTYGDRPVELRRGLYETSAHCYRNELS